MGLIVVLASCSLDAAGTGAGASGLGETETTGATSMGSTDSSTPGSSGSQTASSASNTTDSSDPSTSDATTMPIDPTRAEGSSTGSGLTSDGSTSATTGDHNGCDGVGLLWIADFDQDPTGLDVNGDGVDDWRLRSGDPFPVGELGGGAWTANPGQVLDSHPKIDFEGTTVFEVSMRNVGMGGRGAVAWLNAGYADGFFAPVFAQLQRQGDATQTLRVMGKSDNATQVLLTEHTDLPDALIEVRLEVQTDPDEVTVFVDGVLDGTYPLPSFAVSGNDDRWASLWAAESLSEFAHAEVHNCP